MAEPLDGGVPATVGRAPVSRGRPTGQRTCFPALGRVPYSGRLLSLRKALRGEGSVGGAGGWVPRQQRACPPRAATGMPSSHTHSAQTHRAVLGAARRVLRPWVHRIDVRKLSSLLCEAYDSAATGPLASRAAPTPSRGPLPYATDVPLAPTGAPGRQQAPDQTNFVLRCGSFCATGFWGEVRPGMRI